MNLKIIIPSKRNQTKRRVRSRILKMQADLKGQKADRWLSRGVRVGWEGGGFTKGPRKTFGGNGCDFYLD